MRAFVLAMAAVSAAAAPARADGDLEAASEAKTLPELFAVAVRVAPALEHAAFSLELAEARFTAAQGPHDLTLAQVIDYQRTDGAPIVAGLPGSHDTTATVQIGLRKLLPTNGLLELVGQTSDVKSDISGTSETTVTSSVKLRLTQPLLRGIGPASADKLYEASRLHRNAEAIRRAATARAYALGVVTAYWQLAYAWRTLEIRRDSVELAKKQIALVEAGIRTGKFADSELLPAKQALMVRQQDVRAAELDVVDRSVALRRQVGLEATPAKLALRPVALPDPAPVTTGAAAFVEQAVATSDDLKAAVAEDRSGQAQLAGSRRELLPRADLRLEAGPLGSDTSLARSIDRISDGFALGANLTIELPLGNHAQRGAYELDRANALDLAYQVKKTRDDVAAEAARTVYEVGVHLDSAKLGAQAVDVAKANVEAETRKFELGKSSSAEIVRRQDDLQNVRLREALERALYQVALAELDAATGAILEKYGLRIPEH